MAAGRCVAVPPREPRKDGEACGVGGRPARRPDLVRPEVEDRARACRPGRPCALQRIELVELAGVAVDDERMTVAVVRRRGLSFDRHVRRDRVRALVALVGVLEVQSHLRRRLAVHDGVRDADPRPVPEPVAEVGVHASTDADRGDERRRVRRDRKLVDSLVPRVGRREHLTAADLRRGRRGARRGEREQRGCGGRHEPHGCRSRRSQPPAHALNR